MIGDTPDDIRAGIAAGAIAWGVLTPEEDAKCTLGLCTLEQTMRPSLLGCGATHVLRAGLAEMLDLVHVNVVNENNLNSKPRTGIVSRSTKETSITCTVSLDGTGVADISTGLGFLDHMICQLSKHGRFDIILKCNGDLHIDDHHTAEDCALALGEAFDHALGKREGIRRFGNAYCPLDEALSRVVVDISSRPHAIVDLQFTR